MMRHGDVKRTAAARCRVVVGADVDVESVGKAGKSRYGQRNTGRSCENRHCEDFVGED